MLGRSEDLEKQELLPLLALRMAPRTSLGLSVQPGGANKDIAVWSVCDEFGGVREQTSP